MTTLTQLQRGLCVVLAAHPDDEILGAASLLLRRAGQTMVIYATDGAPRDASLWSPRAPQSRAQYRELRAREARRALEVAGIAPHRTRALSYVDGEAAQHLVPLSLVLCRYLLELRPSVLVAQPYEGGHPDHDACAFAACAAVSLARASGLRMSLVEMASYHRQRGRLCTNVFLPDGPAELVHVLSAEERERKRRMLDCHESQAEVVGAFSVDEERFRRAPAYDFTEPPHPGALHYEHLGWPMRGRDFCVAAGRALRVLGQPPGSPPARTARAEGSCH